MVLSPDVQTKISLSTAEIKAPSCRTLWAENNLMHLGRSPSRLLAAHRHLRHCHNSPGHHQPDFKVLTFRRCPFRPTCLPCLVVLRRQLSCLHGCAQMSQTLLPEILTRTWYVRIVPVADQSPRSLYPSSSSLLSYHCSSHDILLAVLVLSRPSAQLYYLTDLLAESRGACVRACVCRVTPPRNNPSLSAGGRQSID